MIHANDNYFFVFFLLRAGMTQSQFLVSFMFKHTKCASILFFIPNRLKGIKILWSRHIWLNTTRKHNNEMKKQMKRENRRWKNTFTAHTNEQLNHSDSQLRYTLIWVISIIIVYILYNNYRLIYCFALGFWYYVRMYNILIK